MKIIYVHGLDSSANSVKGKLLTDYCQINYPEISIIRPDLNQSPDIVFDSLCNYVRSTYAHNKSEDEQHHSNSKSPYNSTNTNQVVLIGSSLGGYFSTLVSNETGCPAILLNPSIQPHISLQRFIKTPKDGPETALNDSTKEIYRTTGGWSITMNDIEWLENHKLNSINFPNKLFALIKKGDELLDPFVSSDFYSNQKVEVCLQDGGDHRMTDFENQLPMIMQKIISLTSYS